MRRIALPLRADNRVSVWWASVPLACMLMLGLGLMPVG